MTLEEQRPKVQHATNILTFCGLVWCETLGYIMYDPEIGLWTNKENHHMEIINGMRHDIFQCDDITLSKPAYNLAIFNCPIIDAFDVSKSKGFLLFNNGVLDLESYKMLPISSHYNFLYKINRDYTCDDCEILENEIMTRLFDIPFVNNMQRDYFIQLMARGICGHVEDRQILFTTGKTISGKSMLIKMLKNTFGDYVTCFNPNALVAKGDNTRGDLIWKSLFDAEYKRMAFCDGFDTTIPINGTIMKILVSGGDTILCRGLGLGRGPIKVSNNAFIMVFAGVTPSINPCDRECGKRVNVINFDEFDLSINDFIARIDVCDAFISLLSKYYNKARLSKPDVVLE
jgi:hypothetical protein